MERGALLVLLINNYGLCFSLVMSSISQCMVTVYSTLYIGIAMVFVHSISEYSNL